MRSPTVFHALLPPTLPHTCHAVGSAGGGRREGLKGRMEEELACWESAYLMGAPAVTSWGEGQPASPCWGHDPRQGWPAKMEMAGVRGEVSRGRREVWEADWAGWRDNRYVR